MTTPTMLITPVSGDPGQVHRGAAQLATVESRALEIGSRLRAIESGSDRKSSYCAAIIRCQTDTASRHRSLSRNTLEAIRLMTLPDNPIDADEPEISQLAAYLHQDWADEYDDVWDAVRDFCPDQSADEVRSSADQVHKLLTSELDDKQLMDATVKLGIYYYPPGVGLTYREWLRDLEELLRAHG